MINLDFTKLKINPTMFDKFKMMINKTIFKTILVSMLTVIIILAIVFSFAWYYRSKIFNILASSYVEKDNSSIKEDNNAPVLPDFLDYRNGIVNVVKKANPAVVSIIISKEVPKYDVSYNQNNPFGDIFGNSFPDLFFQIPTYKQNGTEKKEVGGGSGFIVSSDGMIVTNKHVVSDKSAEYTVFLSNGEKYVAKILARDPVLDFAVIKITPSLGKAFPYLELADSSKLELGQSVVAIGNALGEFKNTVSEGIISGLSRSITAGDNAGNSEQLDKVIQTDAAINPGNSGGPLLDLDAKVVGINVAVVQGSENVGFALPINSVKSAINSVKQTGKIIRPYIGIRYITITDDLKTKNNLSVDYGILVQRGKDASELAVVPGSPADKAGIVENDIILELNGQKIDKDQSFQNLIRAFNVGDDITLKVLSKGVEKTVYLQLAAAPDSQ